MSATLASAASASGARPAGEPAPALLDSLHVGMGWHDEQPGGLNRMVANLLRHLPAAGVGARALVAGSPAVASLSEGRARAFAALDAPLPWRCWRARAAARAAARSRPPDVLALHFPLFGLAARGTVGNAVPVVVHFHGPWASEGAVEGGGAATTAAKRWVERRAHAGARRFVALSEAFAGVLARDLGVDPDLIRVVPGGVDCERFRPSLPRADARAALGLPGDRPIVLTVRRLAHRMGLPELVTAFAAVRREVPKALLVIGGAGPLMEPLRAQVRAEGLDRQVRLLGRVPDALLPALYRAADLSVVPSAALEGFGLTTAESLAAGTPVLVTRVGGLPEVVRGLDGSLVLPATGPAALAQGIAAALRGTLPLPTAEACAAHARRRFAWPVVAAQVAAVYREALSS